MLSKLFGKKKPEPIFAYAKLNVRLMPNGRGQLFEDPLAKQLEQANLGAVTGGGSLLDTSGEILHCGIDIDMYDADKAPHFICQALNRRGVPKGSVLQYKVGGRETTLPFGVAEGIAVYLNGTELPEHVYKECDPNFVVDRFNALIEPDEGGSGNVLETWHGPTETAIYMYGVSAKLMRQALAPFLAEYPLCQRARVVDIA